jgi:predicted RNA binding protein YcfA (HicA-like mRNA interferase family)
LAQCPSFKAKEVIALLNDYRWYHHDQNGSSHEQFTHSALPGKITVERHAGKDLPTETVRGIFKQAGMLHFFKMFQQGAPWRTVEKAIKTEAQERFPTPGEREQAAQAAVSAATAQPRPGMA